MRSIKIYSLGKSEKMVRINKETTIKNILDKAGILYTENVSFKVKKNKKLKIAGLTSRTTGVSEIVVIPKVDGGLY